MTSLAVSRPIHSVAGLAALVLCLAALAGGCTPQQYAKQADKTGSAAMAQAQKTALGQDQKVSIIYRPLVPQTMPATSMPASQAASAGAPFSGPAIAASRPATTGPATQPARAILVGTKAIPLGEGAPCTITLEEALEIALRDSRGFQDRKEQLFTQALAVANTRRQWDGTDVGGSVDGGLGYAAGDGKGNTNTSTASLGVSYLRKFVTGAQLALGSGVNFASTLTGMDSSALGSLVQANLSQPLLQGAWRDIAYEGQYRAERDLLFAVYDYQRFTQTFAVDIVTQYFNVLQQRDQLQNEQANILRLKQTLALTTLLVRGGERSPLEQDQAQQDLFDAQVRYQQDIQSYSDLLDNFKLQLGLPILARMELDNAELTALSKRGLQALGVDEGAAIALAAATRPDVLYKAAALRDADRNVELAADKFNPQLDLVLGTGVSSSPPRDLTNLKWSDPARSAQLKLAYSLDQTDNRNAYRNAIIAREKAKRDLDLFMDNVTMEVRQIYRKLQQTRQSYNLQFKSVQIARRRQKLAVLQHKSGEVAARDVLDAEEALRNAQNGLTSALISYCTTRLQFLATLGMIQVDEKGIMHERDKPDNFRRIGRLYPYVVAR